MPRIAKRWPFLAQDIFLFLRFCCRKQNGAPLQGCAKRFKIGREVLLGDEAERAFCLRKDCIRDAKANASLPLDVPRSR
jgi:hypothetical protein